MKTFIALTLLTVLQSSTIAKMNWSVEETPACNAIVAKELTAVNSIFCESTKEYSRYAFCSQALCLLQKHPSHCDEVVYESINRLNISLMQDSESTFELEVAVDTYCQSERD
jgi:hypothetical protein